jgi:hypothetical protein
VLFDKVSDKGEPQALENMSKLQAQGTRPGIMSREEVRALKARFIVCQAMSRAFSAQRVFAPMKPRASALGWFEPGFRSWNWYESGCPRQKI